MLAFILRRLAQAALVMVVVAWIAFLLFQYVGDPVVFLLGQDATPEQIRELRADLGLDQAAENENEHQWYIDKSAVSQCKPRPEGGV